LAGIAFPKLLDACNEARVLVSWILLRGKAPSFKLSLESTLAAEYEYISESRYDAQP
jgi:hypothetical protein